MSVLVRSKYLITDARLEEQGILYEKAIYIDNDEFTEIGDYEQLKCKYPHAEVVGNGKQFAVPGFIDVHCHGQGMSYIQRGINYDFLENSLIDWAFAPDIDPELNAMLTSVRHIQNGCTTIHHNDWGKAFDNEAINKSIKRIEGYKKTGIRLAFSPGVRNINTLAYDDKEFYATLPNELQRLFKSMVFVDHNKIMDEYFELFSYLYDKYNSKDLKIILGPSWVQGSTDEFLIKIKDKSNKLGNLPIHIHTLQTPIQKAYGIRKYGKSLISHLDDLGLVNKNLVLGHAVFVNEDDIELLSEKNASTTHHPSCNLIMRNGISPVYYLHKKGVNVALGIDGKGINDDEDIIMEMRMSYLLHRVPSFDLENAPPLSSFDVIQMATTNSSRVCGFDNLGTVEVGKKADIILLDLDKITDNPWISEELSIADAFIHRAKGSDVNTCIIGGKLVMMNRKILTIDVEELYKEVKLQISKGISKEQRLYAENLQKIKPYYQSWYRNWVKATFESYYSMNSRL